MNLAEWDLASIEQQKDSILWWYDHGQWDEYEKLAGQAAAALRREMASISQVTGVEIGAGEALGCGELVRLRQLVLNVNTVLPESSIVKQIPSRFNGFRVQQVNLGDKRKAFLKTWKRLFKEIKGWNEKQTLDWAEKWSDALSGREPSAVYHYGPLKLAVPSLIDESLKKKAGVKLQDLCNEVMRVLWHGSHSTAVTTNYPDTIEEYDWGYVKEEISKIIKKYEQIAAAT